ncbi:DUF6265 family protein [uncultured Microbulbifer sp.]|uniref:DUF6265 family protein n=1 Tax=uncultured Microbulbifer sp. TaxID=348147 RepID=UPI0026248D0F|nr:DUF6265 family protein [uncultured Microbulbifer sp.]
MYLLRYSVFFSIIFTPLAQASMDCRSLEDIDWILGSWVSESSQRTYKEHWSKVSEATYEGYSEVTLTDGKNSGYESLRLVNMAGNIFYLAKVSENTLPIAFKLVSCSKDRLHFENIHHDFPQSIQYAYNNAGNLSVLVAGSGNKGFKLNFDRSTVIK